MLAESDRQGCAMGAAIALTLDWRTIRVLLDISAQRLELSTPRCTLPDLRATARNAAQIADGPAVERSIAFGRKSTRNKYSTYCEFRMPCSSRKKKHTPNQQRN